MEPALRHGDRLVHASVTYRTGDIVVARDPRDPDRWVVKRVASLDAGRVLLASDLDGHESLVVGPDAIVGRALLRYRPLRRFGLL